VQGEDKMSKATQLAEMRKQHNGTVKIHHFEEIDCNESLESYYNNILSEEACAVAVEKYKSEYDQLDEEFRKRTRLTKTDYAFLTLATALQCTRQYLLTSFKPTLDEKATKTSDEAELKSKTSSWSGSDTIKTKQGGYYYASFDSIIADTSVPYDTIAGAKKFNLGLGGTTHRYKTIGHDPILGYIFGTMNILTNTLTTWNMTSFHIRNSSIYSHADTAIAFSSMVQRIKKDPASVATSLIKQQIHIRSDMYTPDKIPFPFISQSPELAMKLAKYGINYADTLTVGKQATLSIAINVIIAMLHRLLLEKDNEIDEKLYEVRTRKILSYSNLIASSSNVIYCCLTKDYKKLDIGGFAVTLYRLFSDANFLAKVKYEFINNQLNAEYKAKYDKIAMYYND
jgi:hypothetical protein